MTYFHIHQFNLQCHDEVEASSAGEQLADE